MFCEHVKLPNGSSAIVTYSGSRKTVTCQFCSSPAPKLCDWPVEKPVKIPHTRLKKTDTIVTVQHKYRLKVQGPHSFTGIFAQRTAPLTGKSEINPQIDRFPKLERVRHRVTMYGLVFPDGRCWLYYLTGDQKVSVLRPGTCDHPICEAHSRSVGENKDYCMEHWGAWESAG